jgi:ABC-type bacteriocin/lantibiotic exporter with double-glycine peptidase domain
MGMLALIPPVPATVSPAVLDAQVQNIQMPTATVPYVPFYSQFKDIESPKWQSVGCGITSLAMVIDFYKPKAVSVNTLLKRGVASGAYDNDVGWNYGGLIKLSQKYGLGGVYYDLSKVSPSIAFAQFQNLLKNGPIILSVHNRFNPQSTVPHLVVIDGIDNNTVYYNDPAAKVGEKQIAIAHFLEAWKKNSSSLGPREAAERTWLYNEQKAFLASI